MSVGGYRRLLILLRRRESGRGSIACIGSTGKKGTPCASAAPRRKAMGVRVRIPGIAARDSD